MLLQILYKYHLGIKTLKCGRAVSKIVQSFFVSVGILNMTDMLFVWGRYQIFPVLGSIVQLKRLKKW